MKKLALLCVALFMLAGSSIAVEKIVFIDLERTFAEFYKTQLAKTKVDAQQADIEAERKIMADEVTAISAEIDGLRKDARDITLADEIRDSKRKLYEERILDLRAKQKAIEDFVAMRQKQVQVQVNRMSQLIMEEIRQTIIEYGKREGYSAIIDNSSRRAAIGVFVYTHPDVEITDSVIAILNSKRLDATNDLFADEPETTNQTTKGDAAL